MKPTYNRTFNYSSPGILQVSDRRITSEDTRSWLAVFDLHGTLLRPVWKEDYALAFQSLTGAGESEARLWVENNVIHKSAREILKNLARSSRVRIKEARTAVQESFDFLRKTTIPDVLPGAKDFLASLRNFGVPTIILTGSRSRTRRRIILRQLRVRGFLELIGEENVITKEDLRISDPQITAYGSFRDVVIKELSRRFPNHHIAQFNDSPDGAAETRRHAGFTFGLPQGCGREGLQNRRTLTSAGADYLLDGWKSWRNILRLMGIPR